MAATDTALAIVPPDALGLSRDPADVIADAVRAAKELTRVLDTKKHPVMFNHKRHLENDEWQVIGHFYGVTARLVSDHYVTFGDVAGWEATCELVRRNGDVVGRATSMCLNDEEKWSARPKYAWAYCLGKGDHDTHEHVQDDPGRDRIVWERVGGKPRPRKFKLYVGTEAVPMFQLRSMAQTRASSKVHASVLRFVAVLAGFGGTPAEELDRDDDDTPVVAATAVPVPDAPDDDVPPPNDADAPATAEPATMMPTGYRVIDKYKFDDGWHHVWFNDPRGDRYAEHYQTKLVHIGEQLRDAFTQHRGVAVATSPNRKRGEPGWVNAVDVGPVVGGDTPTT